MRRARFNQGVCHLAEGDPGFNVTADIERHSARRGTRSGSLEVLLLLCGVRECGGGKSCFEEMNDDFCWRGWDPHTVSSRQLMLRDLFVFPDVTNSLVLQENNLYNEAVTAINDNVYRHS